MTIRFVEDIYTDFLFDCYIANQHLTDEDWHYYGREEHHIETPRRDGGLLTPLNSQSLTTYQHWVAGVLQSEMLGKQCFAFIPKGVLPGMFETLRLKWAKRGTKRLHTPEVQTKRVSTYKQNGNTNTHLQNGETRARAARSMREFWMTEEGMKKRRIIRNRRAPRARTIEVEFPNGRVGVYSCVKLASLALGVTPTTISRWIKGSNAPQGRLKGLKVRETDPLTP